MVSGCENNVLLTNLLRCCEDGIITTDTELVVTYWSPNLQSILSDQVENPVSQKLEYIFPGLIANTEKIKKVLSGEIKNISLLNTFGNDLLNFNIHPFLDSSNSITGLLLFVAKQPATLASALNPKENEEKTFYNLQDLIGLEELQEIQDTFSNATGIASIITDANGNPLTRPSNFCNLCEKLIRKCPEGLANCMKSDAILGRLNKNGPTVQPCLSGGLWDGGTSIVVEGKHVANWLVGQVLVNDADEEKMLLYAKQIGANEEEFRKELKNVTRMPLERFKNICNFLYLLANYISKLADQNIKQTREIFYRKRLEEELLELSNNLSITLDSIGDGVIVTDKDGIIKRMNPIAENLTGLPQCEAVGQPLEDIFNIADSITGQSIENPVLKVQKTLQITELTNHTELTSKNGKKYQISENAAPILNADGSLIGVVLIFRNVSERYKKAKALRKSEERLKRAQQVANVGDWEYTFINKEMCGSDQAFKILGIRPFSCVHIDEVFKAFHPSDLPKLKFGYKKILSGETFKADLKIIRMNDGLQRVVNLIARMMEDDFPASRKIIGTIQDITEYKKAEQELKVRNDELNYFVYKVSHDLRAPLCSIAGLLNLYKLEESQTKKGELVSLVEGRAKKMDLFIRDVLSHSKNLNTEIKIEKIDFHEIIDDCLNELSFLPHADKLDRVINIKGGDFYCDRIRVREIFRNLISNCILYHNPEQRYNYMWIDVTVRNYLTFIKFKDNGVGMEPTVLPHIFEMFYRGNERSDGSGIGLYILQQAVLKLNGDVKVDSKPGSGSKFVITLPNMFKRFRTEQS